MRELPSVEAKKPTHFSEYVLCYSETEKSCRNRKECWSTAQKYTKPHVIAELYEKTIREWCEEQTSARQRKKEKINNMSSASSRRYDFEELERRLFNH